MKEYLISEKVTANERNQRKAHCLTCGCTVEKNMGFMVWIASRGKRVVCENHYNANGLIQYHGNARNTFDTVGSNKVTSLAKLPLGVEIEMKSNGNAEELASVRTQLENSLHCVAESDCTVSLELPSAKMQGLATISKNLQSMESHSLMSLVNNNCCGAHIHVQCNNISIVRRFYHSIFCDLSVYIESMGSEKRIAFFGSDFRQWARPINLNSNPTEHTNIFNTQHEHTLEFRLPRIASYKQYMNCLKFWRECGLCINNFLDTFDDTASVDAKRLQAKSCGKKLVTIAKKYFE